MDLRHRLPSKPPRSSSSAAAAAPPSRPSKRSPKPKPKPKPIRAAVQASDALPLPIRLTNKVFPFIFMASMYYLMTRWREKIRSSIPLHSLSLAESAAIIGLLASLIYLIDFFGIAYVQPFVSSSEGEDDNDDEEEDEDEEENSKEIFNPQQSPPPPLSTTTQCPLLVVENPEEKFAKLDLSSNDDGDEEEEEIVQSVVSGRTPSYILESRLGDTRRAAGIRKETLKRLTGRCLDGLPLDGFDYDSILGQCCEMPIGYVQMPVGVAGPLLLNGNVYYVPMATTEGCLVASTNRGCKAIAESGGAAAVVVKDGMTRAPCVRFETITRAAELKFFLEDPDNFDTLALVFNRSSRFARLQRMYGALAGRTLYIRFTCSTGDAMGMNMVSKGVQNVLDYLQTDFPDMEVISISGNFCADKKPAAVNWIEGRGKSVVCEAVIKEEVVKRVLKTTVPALVELNTLKNLVGSAVAGSLGGYNAHASNIVTAVFIATGQDPAQNVESSHCITLIESVNDGKDLHISVTMPSVEVGTVGGGTQLASQSACLDLLGVKGANMESPGANARLLATLVAGAVLAGELSLMSALAAGTLVKSHMKYNRSSKDVPKSTS